MDSFVARLCVLYEDMRIELYACSAAEIELLDVLDPMDLADKDRAGSYRRNYFLRRSIGTLREFAEAVRLLNDCEEFSRLRAEFPQGAEVEWADAVAFFQSKEPLLQKVRNDIGGHFGNKAADHAIRNMGEDVIGKVELVHDKQGRVDARFHFAGSICAAAFIRHLPGVNVKEQAEFFIRDLLIEGYKHAAVCVRIILGQHLWPRFGT